MPESNLGHPIAILVERAGSDDGRVLAQRGLAEHALRSSVVANSKRSFTFGVPRNQLDGSVTREVFSIPPCYDPHLAEQIGRGALLRFTQSLEQYHPSSVDGPLQLELPCTER